MLFGLGMGSRSESSSLGVVGQGLSSSYYGLSTGSSLTVFLQEFALVGLSLGLIFMMWLVFRLYRDAARNPHSELNTLRYGLLLFSFILAFVALVFQYMDNARANVALLDAPWLCF